MRKFVAIALVALSLGGCAQMQAIGTAVSLGTASVANPVTKERLYQIENSVLLVFTALNTWKSACKQGLINVDCKAQVATVQVYTRQVPPYLASLRKFVRNNDQVNAIVAFNTLTDLLTNAKTTAASYGHNLGG